MSRFTFRCPVWRATEPSEWVTKWAALYGGNDNAEHDALIEKDGLLLGEDFERVGRWKEGCAVGHKGWKAGTPRAYEIWIQAKDHPPPCPAEDRIGEFLIRWSQKRFWAGTRNDRRLEQSFGLSRATTLLHFISGGRYPILDRRVEAAMSRLGSPIEMTIEGYGSFCRLFSEIAAACGVSGIKGLRKLDNALFCYGLDSIPLSAIDSKQADGVKI
jgi:hypothetical protein